MSKVSRFSLAERGGSGSRRIHLREISGDLDSPLDTVGQDLREARLRRGDDLASVSKVLKIRKDYLESLEEDRLESLPGRTYAIGFIRTYADYLGLDGEKCVERYKTEIAGRHLDTAAISVIEADDRKLPGIWKVIAAALVLLLGYGAYHLLSSPVAPTAGPVDPPPAVTAMPDTAEKTTDLASGEMAIPAATSTAEQVGTPANGDVVEISEIGSGNTAFPPLPEGGRTYGLRNSDPRIVLRIHRSTRVFVRGDTGTVFINRLLGPGDSYQVPNFVGLTLSATDAGAVQLDLDGQPVGFAGMDAESVESLSLAPESLVDNVRRPS